MSWFDVWFPAQRFGRDGLGELGSFSRALEEKQIFCFVFNSNSFKLWFFPLKIFPNQSFLFEFKIGVIHTGLETVYISNTMTPVFV